MAENKYILSTQLYNGFVDLLLVVGLDDNTMLIPSGGREISVNEIFDNVFRMTFEPQVLTAVTSSTMTHFFPVISQDPEYPPNKKCPETKSSAAIDTYRSLTRTNTTSVHLSKSQFNRSKSVSPMMLSRHASMRQPNMKKKTQATINIESPVSEEVIKSIPTFCFPDDMRIECYKPQSKVHYLVLTDMSGDNTYATCVTFYRPFIVEKRYKLSNIMVIMESDSDSDDSDPSQEDDQGNIYMSLDTAHDKLKLGAKRCYIPHCCVFISKHPYFSVMKDCLSYMVHKIDEEPEEMIYNVKKFAHILTMTPVPPAGNVAIEFNISVNKFTLYPPESADRPVVDIPLHLVFLCFQDDEILKILSAMLVEERIVFLSSNFALLFIVMESFKYFILPFTWSSRFTYVPVLPAKSLELLEAPGTFMMGCNAIHKKEVEQVEGLVIVDIDSGTVTMNHNPLYEESVSNGNSDGTADIFDIPNIPEEAAKVFSSVCKRARYQYDLADSQRPTCFDMKQEKAYRRQKMEQLNSNISAGCLQLMINLFRSVVLELRIDHQQFNKQEFLSRLTKENRVFYERVFKGEMFKCFLQERMKEKSDYWSEAEIRTRSAFKRVSLGDTTVPSLPSRRPMKRVPSSASIDVFKTTERNMVKFKLPQLDKNLKHYLKSAISSLTSALEKCQDYQERASYTYLRGMFFLSVQEVIMAFEDLTKLEGIDRSILPIKLVQTIYEQLNISEREGFMKRPAIQALRDILMSTSDQHQTKIEEDISIPDRDISYEDFLRILSLTEMTRDYDTVDNVFKALTLDQPQSFIDQATFQAFYNCWQTNHKSCSEMDDSKLLESECVLKISSLCKTDFGTGRIALTDKRLLFLKDVSQDYSEIIKIRDIEQLDKLKLNSFFNLSKLEVLQVIGKKGDLKFCTWLKEERDHWYMLVKEMWSGKIVSEALKDITAVQHAAENVCLIDAVVLSGQLEESFHHTGIQEAMKHLCHFTKYVDEKKHILPEGTIQMLQNRLDPNTGQGRQSVQALLYTIGSGDTKVSPKLWCGMGDGKVKVYDATNWTLETVFVQTKLSVSCLVAFGNQVWAGSHGIFIIDIDTVRSNKTLSDHEDIVMDIVSLDGGRNAYTGSIDGVIHKWDVQTLTIFKKHSIKSDKIRPLRSMKYVDNQLWCGSWQNITIIDLNGVIVRQFQYKLENSSRPIELDCFYPVKKHNEVLAGCRRDGHLIVWDSETAKVLNTIDLKCKGIGSMMRQDDKLWIGTKHGKICIIDIFTKEMEKELFAHDDAVRSICSAEGRYILSGSGSIEGKIAIWNPRELKTESGRYPLQETGRN